MAVSKLGLDGLPKAPDGSYAGKSLASARGHVTALSLSGVPRSLYGSFAGKSQPTVVDVRQRANYNRWRLPTPARAYNQAQLAQTVALIERAEAMNHKTDRDIEVGRDKVVIITSPNGTRWSVTVDDTGTLTTESLG